MYVSRITALHYTEMNKIQEIKIHETKTAKQNLKLFKTNMMRRLQSLVLKHKQHKNKHKKYILYFFPQDNLILLFNFYDFSFISILFGVD